MDEPRRRFPGIWNILFLITISAVVVLAVVAVIQGWGSLGSQDGKIEGTAGPGNPLLVDSNGDGTTDFQAVSLGWDPSNANWDGDQYLNGVDPNPTTFDGYRLSKTEIIYYFHLWITVSTPLGTWSDQYFWCSIYYMEEEYDASGAHTGTNTGSYSIPIDSNTFYRGW